MVPWTTRIINSQIMPMAEIKTNQLCHWWNVRTKEEFTDAPRSLFALTFLRAGAVARLSRRAQLFVFEPSLTVGLASILRLPGHPSHRIRKCSQRNLRLWGGTEGHSYSGRGTPKSLQIFRTSCFLISRCRGTVLVEPVFEFL
jgi:hypothetical protein